MRERKYIRFDFTQALHRRATRSERRDYRIIARTRASDPSSTERSRTPFPLLRRCARFARDAAAHQPTQARSIPDLPIYCLDLRESCLLVRRQFIALADRALRAYDSTSIKRIRRDERIKSKRRACSSQSNFSWELTSDFVTEALRSSGSPRESQRESHDSLRVIRLKR